MEEEDISDDGILNNIYVFVNVVNKCIVKFYLYKI